MADVRKANINEVGNWRTPVLGDLIERAISLVEVREAVNEMKSCKAPGLDGFPVESLKKCGTAILEWLVRPLTVSCPVCECKLTKLPLYSAPVQREGRQM